MIVVVFIFILLFLHRLVLGHEFILKKERFKFDLKFEFLIVIFYLNLPADCSVSAGLGPGGEAELSAGGPPAPLGVKCTISPHLDLAQY